MQKYIIWMIAIFLLAAHFKIQQLYYNYVIDFSHTSGITDFIIDVIANLFLIAAVALILSALFALIPFKKRNYDHKFTIILPWILSIVLLVLNISFGYSLYLTKLMGYNYSPVKYEKITIPENLDCSSVHDGIFETYDMVIERHGDKQTHKDKKTGLVNTYSVDWVSDCEYHLTRVDDPSVKGKIKITEVQKDGYTCYYIYEKKSHRYPISVTLKRIGQNK